MGGSFVIFDIFVNKKSLRLSYWGLNCVKRQVGKVLRGTNDYAITELFSGVYINGGTK